ncbi:MAG: competence type IV pilus major pilin ComGC [Ignavibacteriales bacterium]
MRRSGFTLIELLAVIMILGLIGLIVIPTVTKLLRDSKEKVYMSQVKMIETVAGKWGLEHINQLSETETVYLGLTELLQSGYIKQRSINDPRNAKETMNGCIVIKYDDSYNMYEYDYTEDDCYTIKPLYSDKTGAAIPELTTGMIPVVYDGTNWVKANIKEKWYDYATKEWANAVTVTSTNRTTHLNAAPGSIIPMSDINTMWVWIPRYKYAIPTGTGARSINIAFEAKNTTKSTGTAVDANYLTHPAFTFGTTEVSGMWVGKFETTGTTTSLTILPNTTSLTFETIKTMYDASRAMQSNSIYGTNTDGNIHMAKDSEWGAIAYLSNSIYGKNSEVWINNSSTFTTGCAGNSVSISQYSGCQNQYNTTIGVNASTTGNIYGVYDMSGGAFEYTIGMYRPNDTTSVLDNSGFGATTTTGTLPSNEYWNRYISETALTACSGGICYGNALSETSGWYGDSNGFINYLNPWFLRGGSYNNTTGAGIFNFDCSDGREDSEYSFRLVQVKP